MEKREAIIRELLKELGIGNRYKGYEDLVQGLILLEDEEELLTSLGKGLYVEIQRVTKHTTVSIERNVRTLRNVAWSRHKEHPIFRKCNASPTIGEFWDLLLYEVKERVKRNENGRNNKLSDELNCRLNEWVFQHII